MRQGKRLAALNVKQRTFFEREPALLQHLQAFFEILFLNAGQETDAPCVDAHQRNVQVAYNVSGINKRSVTADGNHEIYWTLFFKVLMGIITFKATIHRGIVAMNCNVTPLLLEIVDNGTGEFLFPALPAIEREFHYLYSWTSISPLMIMLALRAIAAISSSPGYTATGAIHSI